MMRRRNTDRKSRTVWTVLIVPMLVAAIVLALGISPALAEEATVAVPEIEVVSDEPKAVSGTETVIDNFDMGTGIDVSAEASGVPKTAAEAGVNAQENDVVPSVSYRTHVQRVGWQGWRKNGKTAGTSKRSLRLEGVRIKLGSKPVPGGIRYRTHVQSVGWQGWKKNGAMSGTSGKALRLEAIRIKLTGEMAQLYDVWYRVHAQNFGWMGWAKNGASAGTEGYAYRLEAMQVVIRPKGSDAPGPTANAFKRKKQKPVTISGKGWKIELPLYWRNKVTIKRYDDQYVVQPSKFPYYKTPIPTRYQGNLLRVQVGGEHYHYGGIDKNVKVKSGQVATFWVVDYGEMIKVPSHGGVYLWIETFDPRVAYGATGEAQMMAKAGDGAIYNRGVNMLYDFMTLGNTSKRKDCITNCLTNVAKGITVS